MYKFYMFNFNHFWGKNLLKLETLEPLENSNDTFLVIFQEGLQDDEEE